jgi:hypothetical protein
MKKLKLIIINCLLILAVASLFVSCTEKVTVTPNYLQWTGGGTDLKTVTVTNDGSGPVTIVGASIVDTDPNHPDPFKNKFIVTSQCDGKTLGVKESCTIQVQLNPWDGIGKISAKLIVTASSGGISFQAGSVNLSAVLIR